MKRARAFRKQELGVDSLTRDGSGQTTRTFCASQVDGKDSCLTVAEGGIFDQYWQMARYNQLGKAVWVDVTHTDLESRALRLLR